MTRDNVAVETTVPTWDLNVLAPEYRAPAVRRDHCRQLTNGDILNMAQFGNYGVGKSSIFDTSSILGS